jgi:hypothetical protein
LVAVGALFAFQALALVGAQVASAAVVSCSFGSGTLTVNISGTVEFSATASGNIQIDGADTDPLCTSIPATKATLTNTTAITVTGSSGADEAVIDLLVNWGTINWAIDLGAGTDSVTLDGSAATVTTDLDTVAGASGIDLNDDGDLDATVAGVESVDALGGDGDDYLCGSAGTTAVGGPITIPFNVEAGDGYDDVCGGSANDTLNVGGAGDGAVDYLGFTGPITVDLTKATDQITGTGVGSDTTDASDVYGSQGNDTFTGNADYNDFAGGPGDDKIDCGTGGGLADFWDSEAAVTVDLAAGTATGNGNDTLKNCADVYGSDFNDMIAGAKHQDNWIDGAAGLDWVDYSAYATSLTVSLADLDNDGVIDDDAAECDGDSNECDDLLHIENVVLGSGDDTFTGSAFNNQVNPGGGQNSLDGLGGGDTLDYSSYEEGVTVNLAGGGTIGDSALSFENVKGSDFKDNITGGVESNTIKSGKGNDNVKGGSGDDTLRLGTGNDVARGGSGDDDLYGAKGNDYLAGGGGTDLCKGGPGKDKLKGCEIGHK